MSRENTDRKRMLFPLPDPDRYWLLTASPDLVNPLRQLPNLVCHVGKRSHPPALQRETLLGDGRAPGNWHATPQTRANFGMAQSPAVGYVLNCGR